MVDQQHVGVVLDGGSRTGQMRIHHADNTVDLLASLDLQALGTVVADLPDAQIFVQIVDQFFTLHLTLLP